MSAGVATIGWIDWALIVIAVHDASGTGNLTTISVVKDISPLPRL